jgi:hypothetical protein
MIGAIGSEGNDFLWTPKCSTFFLTMIVTKGTLLGAVIGKVY